MLSHDQIWSGNEALHEDDISLDFLFLRVKTSNCNDQLTASFGNRLRNISPLRSMTE